MNTAKLNFQFIPREVQLNILTYLRAYDLSAVQLTCRFFNDPSLIDGVVRYAAHYVYSPQLTSGILIEEDGGKIPSQYTLEHLRSIELTVVARVLSLPEPKQGFYVSKSWIKKTLLWLETVNDPSVMNKKKSNKKQTRQRARRLSDISPPWPDANSDILCSHQNLQRCGAKAARSRRRLMDKQAWKILKKLYPDSTQLESIRGECLQCLMESETAKKNECDRLEQEKLRRKMPLANPYVRRLYTRTRGFPSECISVESSEIDRKVPPENGKTCPLKPGSYVVLPRAWCHQWRKYMRTGEGGMPIPPDSSALLCDAHKCALLPPHLEAFLMGLTTQLLSTVKVQPFEAVVVSPRASHAAIPVGLQPILDIATLNSMMAAGMTQAEVATQQMAMLRLQHGEVTAPIEALASPPRDISASLNDMLDRENHIVVELVTEAEWLALQDTGCWPKSHGQFSIQVSVQDDQSFSFSTNPCRECDPTGSRYLACAEVKYRRKRWEPKIVEQKRAPRVEY